MSEFAHSRDSEPADLDKELIAVETELSFFANHLMEAHSDDHHTDTYEFMVLPDNPYQVPGAVSFYLPNYHAIRLKLDVEKDDDNEDHHSMLIEFRAPTQSIFIFRDKSPGEEMNAHDALEDRSIDPNGSETTRCVLLPEINPREIETFLKSLTGNQASLGGLTTLHENLAQYADYHDRAVSHRWAVTGAVDTSGEDEAEAIMSATYMSDMLVRYEYSCPSPDGAYTIKVRHGLDPSDKPLFYVETSSDDNFQATLDETDFTPSIDEVRYVRSIAQTHFHELKGFGPLESFVNEDGWQPDQKFMNDIVEKSLRPRDADAEED